MRSYRTYTLTLTNVHRKALECFGCIAYFCRNSGIHREGRRLYFGQIRGSGLLDRGMEWKIRKGPVMGPYAVLLPTRT